MKRVLIISSWVASSQVGARTSANALNALGIETVILPTTQMGRHPGWGPPGGGVTDPARLRDLWAGVKAQKLHFDAVLTGYMGHVDHIELAREIIDELRRGPGLQVLIDPIMGDTPGGLYVARPIARAIKTRLVPQADTITPNMWELDFLTDDDTHPASPETIIVTSVPMGRTESGGEKIGAQMRGVEMFSVEHDKLHKVPSGSGDLLAALYLGHVLSGLPAKLALTKAVMTTFAALKHSVNAGRDELVLVGQDLSGQDYDI
ncbi:bifunctional hydroxymethylpyrimidine kinase/phosphomethylpyrimidine kinase [Robiginitomaculum antarcticum]|uniref:bifunctional hydroxymethylpyrimidine kinase/phosphomethylpyrimidine kinase n=1 Tax=Robiginitomaculum antarcticum TaxID=437507 RepID=UPI00036E13D3|nr:bifunctional hydroxymethylpyrimidine kinase/phosphomethylpyrimidine kinase [Robiginitomaculum antarcticum]